MLHFLIHQLCESHHFFHTYCDGVTHHHSFSAPGGDSDLHELLRLSVNSRQLTCVYSLKSEHENRSPHSDPYTIRDASNVSVDHTEGPSTSQYKGITRSPFIITSLSVSTSTTTEQTTTTTTMSTSETTTYISTSTTTDQTTTTTTMSTSETTTNNASNVSRDHTEGPSISQYKDTWFIVLVSTGVAVILFGLICLCRFTCKKRRKLNKTRPIKSEVTSQGTGTSCSEPADTYSLITSVPASSFQPISGGLEHPESHQDSTADPRDTRCVITSINPVYQPSDVLINKQKQGNTEENENVYHLYCTIPDKPVHSSTEDHVYSLLKMH
ncbi:hypothetical protein QQF64_004035 [Cirrhinus molitorella]|uniref:Uncharacterized protein n=1 Tax=Cirrhinus molitorella TaxID=172907 RepID=A0ABR3MMZ9_9TELE